MLPGIVDNVIRIVFISIIITYPFLCRMVALQSILSLTSGPFLRTDLWKPVVGLTLALSNQRSLTALNVLCLLHSFSNTHFYKVTKRKNKLTNVNIILDFSTVLKLTCKQAIPDQKHGQTAGLFWEFVFINLRAIGLSDVKALFQILFWNIHVF